jgi:predicted PurR-regulated permease PerM
MPLLQTSRDRAAFLILVLALLVLLALTPFLSGLLGAAVLYVVWIGPYRRLQRVSKPGIAAAVVLVSALVVIALPAVWVLGLVIGEAPDALRRIQSSGVLARVAQMRVGDLRVGAEFAKASGAIVSWLSSHLIAFVGGATSAVLNLVIAFFALYYMLRSGGQIWAEARGYIPFSAHTADALRDRFFDVTEATLFGTVIVAIVQGALVGTGFWAVGLSNPLFWGTVTAFASVLPVLGSGLVWVPATLVLVAQGRYRAAVVMLVIGAGVASNIDNLIRPLVYKRVSNIHPMITLVGAFAGVQYFGLLGILIGPLAIAYLFELLKAYREEYGTSDGAPPSSRSLP